MTRRLTFAAVALCGLFVSAGAGTASASDCHRPHCVWKTVTLYKTIQQPRIISVIRYTECGKPYQARKVISETVRVPYTKRIRVCY